jgi:outer membrane receptor protein involved in Fe transport
MVYEGAIVELDLWDLDDIERVEVVRGPGSVTYGTGAIAGVINIITKSANSNLPTASVSLSNNHQYRSNGVNFQYHKKADNFGLYSFLSYRQTDGLLDAKYFQISKGQLTDQRYVGHRDGDSFGPEHYLADGLDRPQIKGHLDLSVGDALNVWMRYTQSGQSHGYRTQNQQADGEIVNSRNVSLRSFVTSADHNYKVDADSNLDTSLTYSNQEYLRYNFRNPEYDVGATENIRQYAFSQERIVASALYNYQYEDTINVVLGYEYSRIGVHSPWGKDDSYIWIHEGIDLISDNNSSAYVNVADPTIGGQPDTTDSIEVGSGLIFETHTQLLESNFKLSETMDLSYAHRIDFSDVSDTMFSPRLSLVSQINLDNITVITAQRALRMMPLRAQYLADINNESDQHESIDSLEISLTNTRFDDISLNIRGYYNKINAVGFTGSKLEFLSEMEVAGLDFEGRYKTNSMELSINHSYLDLLSMDMNDELKDGSSRNNISFADYYYNTSERTDDLGEITRHSLQLRSYGDGLNNWSTHSTKLLLTNYFNNDRLRTHINAQVYWDYDGAYDEMGMFQQAYDNFDTTGLTTSEITTFTEQKAEFEYERALLEAEDAYKHDVSVNASIVYDWQKDKDYELSMSIYMDNIFSTKKRYYVSTGSNDSIPNRLRFLDEPRSIGVSLQLNFR